MTLWTLPGNALEPTPRMAPLLIRSALLLGRSARLRELGGADLEFESRCGGLCALMDGALPPARPLPERPSDGSELRQG